METKMVISCFTKMVKSCFTCLAKMNNNWYSDINNGDVIGCVTLDFKKAFDILSHNIVLKKLGLYGCHEMSLSWFDSYLKNRSQVVNIDHVMSPVEFLEYGVPQGSILGPLIFILFINDIVFEVKYSTFSIYADDTNLSCHDTDVFHVQWKLENDLKQIESWCYNNKMIVNTTKSKVILICSQQKRAYLPSNSLNVTVCGETLECVTSQKVLGLIIDQNLTWKPHNDNLCSEIFKLIGLLWRNKSLLPFACKQLFYNSYIQPKIDYFLPLWGNASKAPLDKLWRLQKKAVFIIHNAPFDAPSHDLFCKLNCLNIHQRYFYQICLCTFTILNTPCSPLSDLLTLHIPNSSYALRSNNDYLCLKVPFPHKEMYKSSLSYSCSFLWNKLPIELRSNHSLASFKKDCKNYILLNSITNDYRNLMA